VLTNIDQVAAMSEAAAALGRKDADRWLAKAVIDVAAEAAHRPAAGADAADGEARQAPAPDGLVTPAGDQRPPAGGQYPQAPGRHRHAR